MKGTRDFELKYSKVDDFKLIGYSDSYFDGNEENGVFTSGYLRSLGSTTIYIRFHNRDRIYHYCRSNKIYCVAKEDTQIFSRETSEFYSSIR